jgi:outer membrane murein-binding lipoprotein Lpp
MFTDGFYVPCGLRRKSSTAVATFKATANNDPLQSSSIAGELGSPRTTLDYKIDQMDAKMDALGSKMDAKIDALGSKMDAKMDALGSKMDALGSKMDAKIDALGSKMDAKMDAEFRELSKNMKSNDDKVVKYYNESANQKWVFLAIFCTLASMFPPIASFLSSYLKTVP